MLNLKVTFNRAPFMISHDQFFSAKNFVNRRHLKNNILFKSRFFFDIEKKVDDSNLLWPVLECQVVQKETKSLHGSPHTTSKITFPLVPFSTQKVCLNCQIFRSLQNPHIQFLFYVTYSFLSSFETVWDRNRVGDRLV